MQSLASIRMAKGPELSRAIRLKIVEKSAWGASVRQIAAEMNLKPSTVGYQLSKQKKLGTTETQARSGRPRKLGTRDTRAIVRQLKAEPRTTCVSIAKELEATGKMTVSAETIRRAARDAGLNGRVARKKPLLKKRHKQARLAFAKEHCAKPASFWKTILWSDETKIRLFESDGKVYVWRHVGEAFKDCNVVPTVKHGGGGVMVWGCMASSGVGNLHFIDGIMDRFMYKDILEKSMIPSAKKLLGKSYIFQHDNDPKHTSKLVKEFLQKKRVKVLFWPAMSPDLNPIEHIWGVLKQRVKAKNPSSIPALKDFIQSEWSAISTSVCEKYVNSMPSRLSAVMKANGGHTKY